MNILKNKKVLIIIFTIIILAIASLLILKPIFRSKAELKTEANTVNIPEEKEEEEDVSISTGGVSVWDIETFSFKRYESYDEHQKIKEEKIAKETEEYYKAIKGTLVEKVLNLEIPSFDIYKNEQLVDGELECREKENVHPDFLPDGLFKWSAELVKNQNSFLIADFNKDGLDDVAHIARYNWGGSGHPAYLLIFLNNGESLEFFTGKNMGGDDIINGLDYEKEIFLIETITVGEGENFKGFCCPNTLKIKKYKLKGEELIEVKEKKFWIF